MKTIKGIQWYIMHRAPMTTIAFSGIEIDSTKSPFQQARRILFDRKN